MTLYAIDPGTEQSALLVVEDGRFLDTTIYPNRDLLSLLWLGTLAPAHLVIEQIESYGMAVGREVFQTVFWSGRFVEAWQSPTRSWSLLPRRDVKLTLCGSPKAKDANIRQALIDRYGGSSAIKKGGPLYGIKSHLWAALALAETYQQQRAEACPR